jgi:sirohydrochlorin ferrochelatase/(2Fe-2S) ferredoxin
VVDTCVLFVGHGSRDPGAKDEFEHLAALYRTARPDVRVEVAYIELAKPLLADALATLAPGARRLVLLPLFLFAAGHVKIDLPLAVDEARRRFPETSFVVAEHLGVHSTLVELALTRLEDAFVATEHERKKTLLLVVGRGSSDPDANGDFVKVTRLVGDGRGFLHVEPAFIGVTQPSVEVALERAARLGAERVVVLPYFLFAGRLVTKLAALVAAFRERHPWIRATVAAHLGVDERLLPLLDERSDQAARGRATLPCDNCHFKTRLPGSPSQVGGLRAMLYSVRHTLLHSQAAMPLHTHRPLKKHVLVCVNADCADRGSYTVLETFRSKLKAVGRSRDIKVTRTSCMGRCGEGPTVAIYPDGVWYRGVRAEDAFEIVDEHLLHDRLVGRLVGDILH